MTFFCHCLAYMKAVQNWVQLNSFISFLDLETEYIFNGLIFFMRKHAHTTSAQSSRAHWNYIDFL